MKKNILKLIKSYEIIFWDFDGVIKESNEIKAEAFIRLFNFASPDIKKKIRRHHYDNLGISRFKKIPLYMKWSNLSLNNKNTVNILNKLSKILIKEVSSSKWIKGVYGYIKSSHKKQTFILLTATPQKEIDIILKKIKIYNNFFQIYGSPLNKTKVIRDFITDNKIKKNIILFIGDSESDYKSAMKNEISFLLRKNVYNQTLQSYFKGNMFENLLDE